MKGMGGDTRQEKLVELHGSNGGQIVCFWVFVES